MGLNNGVVVCSHMVQIPPGTSLSDVFQCGFSLGSLASSSSQSPKTCFKGFVTLNCQLAVDLSIFGYCADLPNCPGCTTLSIICNFGLCITPNHK